MSAPPQAVVVGAGIGGLALGIRLRSLGVPVTILEKLDAAGGRAYTRRIDGYTFDMGPTVLTVPSLIDDLFRLRVGEPRLDEPDLPDVPRDAMQAIGGERPASTEAYVRIVPIAPFYRIFFDDGEWFDYDGDREATRRRVDALSPGESRGYDRFHDAADAIFRRGFLELGHRHFGSLASMLRIVPDLYRLGAIQPLYRFVSQFVRDERLRAVLSFESLLVGGNPLRVPAIYAMIHFVEKTWGVHFARGGTGELVRAFVRKFEELGGVMRYNTEVAAIETERRAAWCKPEVRGVVLGSGERIGASIVASNADYARTYGMIDSRHRLVHPNLRLRAAKQSMSVVVVYFGFRADPAADAKLRHHNIILGPRYAGLLRDIFDRKILADDFSQYLHVPTLTDTSMAPPGHHAAYTLVPVPHNGSGIDWEVAGPKLVERVLTFLDERGYIPRLRERLTVREFITPQYFEHTLNSRLGNAFGLEPIFAQSAFFRPHNRSEDVRGLYLVGAGAQPGGGTPAVMMSAKMTARLVAEDLARATV